MSPPAASVPHAAPPPSAAWSADELGPRWAHYGAAGGDRLDQCFSYGVSRPAWRSVLEHLGSLDDVGVNRMIASVTNAIRDDDVPANGLEDSSRGANPSTRELNPNTPHRQWRLSAMPTVIGPEAWTSLETGLADRVETLEQILDDLLGPRHLIREGIVPAGVLWQNPIFHRALTELPPPRGRGDRRRRRLVLTAAEVVRIDRSGAGDGGSDSVGQWIVTGDRTRAPSGLGYVMENRIATGSVWSGPMRQAGTRRLANFYDALRTELSSLSDISESPRVAILTPRSERYRQFEDAFLARYLGLTLAQGTDLAVRGDRLYLKTIGGLVPVDVLWRHINDRQCDPLSLAPRSIDGVPGLLRTIRSGRVAMANAMGSGLVQTPALFPYVVAAAKFLTGAEPRLPTMPTWWCGDPRSLDYVLEHLPRLVIKPAFRTSRTPTAFASEMDAAALSKLRDEIRRTPHRYVATEMPPFATTPVFQNGRVASWPMAMRCFTLSGSQHRVMPGGLVRLAPRDRDLMFSAISGTLTQDLWVCGTTEDPATVSLLPAAKSIPAITRFGDELPSRVAEQFYWLARYIERAESIARLLRTSLVRVGESDGVGRLVEGRALFRALAALGQIEPGYGIDRLVAGLPDADSAIHRSIFNSGDDDGLHRSLDAALDAARSVRDRLPVDGYRTLVRLVRSSRGGTGGAGGPGVATSSAKSGGRTGGTAAAVHRLDRIIEDCLTLVGMIGENFVRSGAWPFLQMGQSIERAMQTSELLLAMLVTDQSTAAAPPPENLTSILEAVLEITDSQMIHRARYPGVTDLATVLDMVVTDDTNPRSIAFQIHRVDRLLRELAKEASGGSGGNDPIAVHRGKPVADPGGTAAADVRWVRSLSQRLAETELISMAYPDGMGRPGIRLDGEAFDRRQRLLVDLLAGFIGDLPWLDRAITGLYLLHTDVYVSSNTDGGTDDLNEAPEANWIDVASLDVATPPVAGTGR